MTVRRRPVAVVLTAVLALTITACGSPQPPPPPRPERSSVAPESPVAPSPPAATGEALAAAARLCPNVPATQPGGSRGPVPRSLREVQVPIERARGLEFLEPVDMRAVDPERMAALVREQIRGPGVTRYLRDRGRALEAMGAVPPGTDLARAYEDFTTSQVIGFYDPNADVLVFVGEERLSAFDRFTLVHELLHAIEDQNFDLDRLLAFDENCRDELGLAARGLAEGSATAYSLTVLQQAFTADELTEIGRDAMSADIQLPRSVPDFMVRLEEWPYLTGMSFVAALRERGGDAEVDRAFEQLPVSSEQIMHPERYPDDVPVELDVPDILGPAGWETIDVGEVGEAWLGAYLDVAGADDPASAAEGWDGGIYRAWAAPSGEVVVILATAWDSAAEAQEFASAISDAMPQAEVRLEGDRVTVRFERDGAGAAAGD